MEWENRLHDASDGKFIHALIHSSSLLLGFFHFKQNTIFAIVDIDGQDTIALRSLGWIGRRLEAGVEIAVI